MTTLIEFVQQPLVLGMTRALGWTLLHFCWQGAIVAAALWFVLGLMGQRWSQARYAAACVALALLVALPVGTFVQLAKAEVARQRLMAIPVTLDFSVDALDGAGTPQVPLKTSIKQALDESAPWVPAAWLVGVVLFVMRLNVGLVAARRLQTAGTGTVSVELQEMFERLRESLGVGRAVRLMHSAMVQVPTVIGWLRPVVLVPASCFTGLSEMQIEAIFRHELAHVRRHDYLVSVFQSVVEALLFYHPAVWWVSKQVRRERECCCDELAVAQGGDVLAYARALSLLEERRASFPEFVLGANGGALSMRIRRLLGYGSSPMLSMPAAIALSVLVLAAAGVYFDGVARAQAKLKVNLGMPIALVDTPAPNSAKLLPEAMAEFPKIGRVRMLSASAESRPLPQQAQAGGTIEGTVYDPTGALVPRAKLTATNSDSGAQMTFQTDNTGKFSFDALPPGNYRLEVDARGFQRLVQGDVRIGTGQTVALNLKLNIGAAAESLTVTDKSAGTATAGQATGPVKVRGSVLAQQAVSQPAPVYPPIAKAAHVQGAVVLKAIVSKMGTVENLQVMSGPPMLTTSAMEAVRRWTYKPYLLNGQPIEVETTITVNFSLPDDGAPKPGSESGASANQNPNRPQRVSAGVIAGLIVSNVAPIYPPDAKAAHIQGAVVLHALISKAGEIENLQVVSGPPELVNSALDAVKQWKYKPYLLNGEPTEVETTITVNYSLADSDKPEASGSAPGASAANDVGVGALKQISGTVPVRILGPQNEGPDENGVWARPVKNLVHAPVLVYSKPPEYSAEARKDKVSGKVLVHFWVDQHGRPLHVTVVHGVGHGLDEKAVESVQGYRFKPATEDGKKVVVAMNTEVNFQIF